MRQSLHILRRSMLLSGVVATAGALTRPARAQGQRYPGPDGVGWLDYEPPRRHAAAARVGNIVHLSGERGLGDDITAQTSSAFANIQKSLGAFGSDLQDIFKITVYLVNIVDVTAFSGVRDAVLPRPVPSTVVAVTHLLEPDALVEIEVIAVIPTADTAN